VKEFVHVLCIEIEATLKLYILKVGLGLVEWICRTFWRKWVLEVAGSVILDAAWFGLFVSRRIYYLNRKPIADVGSFSWLFANFISSQFIPSTEISVQ